MTARSAFLIVCLVTLGAVAAPVAPGRAAAPAGQFTNNGNGTITDNRTGLIWQQVVTTTTYTHANAITYCANLTLGGSSNWRLPELVELETIRDECDSTLFDSAYFGAAPTMALWSNTVFQGNTANAWSMSVNSFDQPRTALNVVRCVR